MIRYVKVFHSSLFQSLFKEHGELMDETFRYIRSRYGPVNVRIGGQQDYMRAHIKAAGLPVCQWGGMGGVSPGDTIILIFSRMGDTVTTSMLRDDFEKKGYIVHHAVHEPFNNREHVNQLKEGLL